MTGLDTDVLVRYFLGGTDATPATRRQASAARRLIEGDAPLQICKTVLLELEWVLRGLYATTPAQFVSVLDHLLALPHVTLEDRLSIEAALDAHRRGLDFADALHLASCRTCTSMASFDDRGFARKAARLKLAPSVSVPR